MLQRLVWKLPCRHLIEVAELMVAEPRAVEEAEAKVMKVVERAAQRAVNRVVVASVEREVVVATCSIQRSQRKNWTTCT